jgi:hypothetical protein
MRASHVLLAIALCCALAVGQTSIPDGYVWTYFKAKGSSFSAPTGAASTYNNNASTGTVCNALAKQDASSNAVVTAGGETQGVIGVAIIGCGTTGPVTVFFSGDVQLKIDTASPTLSDYVGISASSGFGTDVGASPPSGQNIGQIRTNPFTGAAPSSCNVAPGCWVHLEIGSGSGGGGGGCGGSCMLLNPVGSQTVNQPTGSTLTINSPSNPIVIAATGSINGVTTPDSGSAAQILSTNNTAGFFSGAAPNPDTCYAGGNSFQPLFSSKVGGVAYSTQLEEQCLKDQKGGYPSLDSNLGTVPINELVVNSSNCNSSTVIAGDQSGCVTGSSSVGFDQITTGGVTKTNSGPGTWIIGNGLKLQFDGTGGIINANQLNFVSWPSGAAGGGLNQINAVPVVVAATGTGATMGVAVIPNCNGVGAAIGFNSTTHSFPCQNVALNAAHPMIRLSCDLFTCPNSTAVVGTGSTIIFYSVTIAANQLSVDGQCLDVRLRWKHSTAASSVTYSWNVGGTGSVGGAVTGGITTSTTSNNTGASALIRSVLTVCRDFGASVTNAYVDQYQFGSNTGSGGPISGSINWTLPQQINLLFNVPNTDALTFWGGEVYYP